MARRPRFNLPGYPQHVIQRGNNREPCFFSPGDFRFYLYCLQQACLERQCALHAYVLMTNHVHLLLTPAIRCGVSRVMQDVGRKYVRFVNRSYQRTGTLWEGRYKAGLVDTDRYLLTCYRYIEMNPVRAGIAACLSDYPWSSYHCNASGRADPVVQPHPAYLDLSRDGPGRRRAYRDFCGAVVGQTMEDDLRAATNRELVFGSNEFKRRIERTFGRQTRPARRGRPRWVPADG